MDITSFTQAVTMVGFPIVMCGAMGWYVKYITDKNRDDIQKINDQHRSEMTDVTTALNNNTLALQKLTDYMQGGNDNAKRD